MRRELQPVPQFGRVGRVMCVRQHGLPQLLLRATGSLLVAFAPLPVGCAAPPAPHLCLPLLQHRDIYGLEQRDNAGRDCTCSFKPNVATACLSLGSSRRCLVQSEVDAMSDHNACCEECDGFSCSHWLRSGDLMYFNDVWNRSYTHGIPPHDVERDGVGGPRISIALLCAESASKDALCILPPKSKQKVYGLTMPPRTPLAGGTPSK